MASYGSTLKSIYNAGKKYYNTVTGVYDKLGKAGKILKGVNTAVTPGLNTYTLAKSGIDTGMDILGIGNKQKNSGSTNYGTAIGPTQDGGFLGNSSSNSSGSSYGGGSGGSSYSSGATISPDTLYDAEREAYLQKYNTAVEAAKNANAQDLKSLSDYIERFREDTKTKRERLEKSYDTQASNLLKSIERFRESNAQDVADQRRAYLTNQAALESARAEADRQSRISAAARGLGGSGLQQLSQLQNLINQSQDISEVATENQTVMDNLRKALAEANQDYQDTSSKLEDSRRSDLADLDTALSRAEQDYTTNVQKANDNLRDLLAQYASGKAENDVSALSNLYSRVSSGSSGGGSGSSSSGGSAALSFLADQFQSNLSDIASMTDKEFDAYKKSNNLSTSLTKQQVANNLMNEATSTAIEYGLDNNNYSGYRNNLNSILAGYNLQKQEENKKKNGLNLLSNIKSYFS